MTRGGRYYEELKYRRRRRQQFRAKLKSWLKWGALLAFCLVLGTLVWEQYGQVNALQKENAKMRQELHRLIERTDKILGDVDQVSGYIKDLRPHISDGEAWETAAAIWYYSKKYKADTTVILAMANAESSFNRWAIGGVGERGILQVRPETFQDWGYGDFTDWRATLEAGVRYYKWLERRYGGNLQLTIAAYNAGPGRVADRVPEIKSTQRHVRKVMLAFRGMRR